MPKPLECPESNSRAKLEEKLQSAISPWATGHVSMFEFVG